MTTAIIGAFVLILVLAVCLGVLRDNVAQLGAIFTKRIRALEHFQHNTEYWQKHAARDASMRRQEVAALAVHLRITYGYREPSQGEVYIIDQEKQPTGGTHA